MCSSLLSLSLSVRIYKSPCGKERLQMCALFNFAFNNNNNMMWKICSFIMSKFLALFRSKYVCILHDAIVVTCSFLHGHYIYFFDLISNIRTLNVACSLQD